MVEGISLKQADCLVYYNIDFSATSYWQSRDRMTTKHRLKNNVYWVFTRNGIEPDIYKAVTKRRTTPFDILKRLIERLILLYFFVILFYDEQQIQSKRIKELESGSTMLLN